jgi:hypothetical protein
VDQNQAAVDVTAKRLAAHAHFTALPGAQPPALPA